MPAHRTPRQRPHRIGRRLAFPVLLGLASAAGMLLVVPGAGGTVAAPRTNRASLSTVWLCRPGTANDPCTTGLDATSITASGSKSEVKASDAASPKADCFYVYPTVSRELSTNADLRIQKSEIDVAESQAARFSQVCRVWSPMYRQVTLVGLAESPNLDVSSSANATAYDSVASGFKDYLQHDNDGRPIVFIGHSQGAAMLIVLLSRMVDNDPSLRSRLLLAIILGGNVEVRTGSLTGGSFSHIPLCSEQGESGCVIAYSSFPSEPPADSLFGRAGQGVSLQSDQRATKGLQVACVNPASIGGGSAELTPYFPSEGSEPTPWVTFPGLYSAACKRSDGATWLQVSKSSGSGDERPLVSESDGPEWGYHGDDVNLGLGNLVSDVAAAEARFPSSPRNS